MKHLRHSQAIAHLLMTLVIASAALCALLPGLVQADDTSNLGPRAIQINEEEDLEKRCFSGSKNALIPLPAFRSEPLCQDYRVVLLFLKKMANTAIQFVLAIALIFLILTGYQFITSVGDKTGMENAKRSLLYIVIGILAVLGAFMLVTFISSQFLDIKK